VTLLERLAHHAAGPDALIVGMRVERHQCGHDMKLLVRSDSLDSSSVIIEPCATGAATLAPCPDPPP
jgi:hypothetical protein